MSRFGANLMLFTLTYWPPEVGAIEAISAMLNMTKNMQKQVMRNIQIAPAVPPLVREKIPDANPHSHVQLSQHVRSLAQHFPLNISPSALTHPRMTA